MSLSRPPSPTPTRSDVSHECISERLWLDRLTSVVVNGEKTGINIHLANTGSKNYTLVSASSSFHDPLKDWALIRNSTALRYNVPLVSGANFSAPYSVNSEYRPGELGLTVWVNLAEQGSAEISRITALNQTVSIVEQPTSWLDASLLLLWLILGSALAGGAYAVYQTFFAPKTKKGKRVQKKKAVVVNEKTEDYPKVKPYEEDWIPAHHLKSRASKTKRDGGASSGGEELLSAGEATSGAESGTEGKARRRKGKKA